MTMSEWGTGFTTDDTKGVACLVWGEVRGQVVNDFIDCDAIAVQNGVVDTAGKKAKMNII